MYFYDDLSVVESAHKYECRYWKISSIEQLPVKNTFRDTITGHKTKYIFLDTRTRETTEAIIIDMNEKIEYISLWNVLALFSFTIIGIWLKWKQPEYILINSTNQCFRVAWQKVSYQQYGLEGWSKVNWQICRSTLIGFLNGEEILQLLRISNIKSSNSNIKDYFSIEKKVWLEDFFLI